MNLSKQLLFENLNNTRDLGGMETADGHKIKEGKLIRSGHLYRVSEADSRKLQEMIELIVDFRTETEKMEKPDPEMDGIQYLSLPALDSLTAGVSRDKQSDKKAFDLVWNDPSGAREYMIRTYTNLVSDKAAVSRYSRFFKELMVSREKAVLWHCTAGKDRAGLAAAFIQETLGVERPAVIADYLKTNEYLAGEIQDLMQMFAARFKEGLGDETRQALGYLFGACEEFIQAAYDKIDEIYGDFTGFLRTGLQITEKDQQKLKQMYLN